MGKSLLENPRIQRFIIRFFAIFFLVEVFLILFPPLALQILLARGVGSLLGLPTNGVLLWVNGIAFEISAFCTGLSTWGLWAGLLYGFSFPRGAKKLEYALAGLVAILLVNFLRLLLVVRVGMESHFAIVDALHTLTWFAMSALVLGVWYFMLCTHLKTNKSEKIAHFLLNEKKK